MSEPTKRSWPGWDGGLLVALGVGAGLIYLFRGQLGGELQLSILLSLNLVYLAGSWWMRR